MALKGAILELLAGGEALPNTEYTSQIDGVIVILLSAGNNGVDTQAAMWIFDLAINNDDETILEHNFLVPAGMSFTQLVTLPSRRGMIWKWYLNVLGGADINVSTSRAAEVHMPYTN